MTKKSLRIFVDILLLATFVFSMGGVLCGSLAHEVAGTIMLAGFIAHNWLNWGWYRSLGKGGYTALRIAVTVLALLSVVDMLFLLYSSLVISHHIFTFLPRLGRVSTAWQLHLIGAYWGIIIMGLHLGLNWNKFLRYIKLPVLLQRIAALMVAVYGICMLVLRGCIDCMLLESYFIKTLPGETVPEILPDYVAMIGAFVFIGHYLGCMLRKNR